MKRSKHKYTKQDLLDYLKELSIKLGRTPTASDFKYKHKIKLVKYTSKFGNFSNAQKAAGFTPTKSVRTCKQYTKGYLLDYLKELSIKLGRTPTVRDIKNEGKIKIYLYYKIFEKLSDAQKAAGLVPFKSGSNCPQYTEEDLLEHLKELSIKLGRTPTVRDIKNEGKINLSLYYKIFGKFSDAKKAAGFVPIKDKYTVEYLINYLKELSIKLGRTPTRKDIYYDDKIKYSNCLINFGNINNAQKAAGLVPIKDKYTVEYLIKYIKELSIKLGRTPTRKDIYYDGKLKPSIYYIKFGSFKNAQIEAGLVPGKLNNNKKILKEEK